LRSLPGVLAVFSLLLVACTSSTAETTTTTSLDAASTTAETTTTTSLDAVSTTVELESVVWADVTDTAIGLTEGYSNKVDLADIDGDGDVDLLFADGGFRRLPGDPVVNQIWVNDGNAQFEDKSVEVLGDVGDLARVMKARDLNGDGIVDIVVGTTYETQSRLFLGSGGLEFEEVTSTNLPQVDASVGDIEIGDVDGDGDLDLVLADWGPGNPTENAQDFGIGDWEGSSALLWLNDGAGVFTDVSVAQMPQVAIRYSWELELVDIDNDFDLDIAISCKSCEGSFLFENDGSGQFADVSDRMPQHPNNYEFEPVDLDGDGFLDLITINDLINDEGGLKENVFLADGRGGFLDSTADLWPDEANLRGVDDGSITILDFDSDGDPDFVIGSLGGPDRLLLNDGNGHLSLITDDLFGGRNTTGTLGIAVADLNGDGKLDLVMAQGEFASDERVFIGNLIEPDTAPPIVGNQVTIGGIVHVRIHDNKSPTVPTDWTEVTLTGTATVPMNWYGEFLWRAPAPSPGDYQICATDAAGNQTCSDSFTVE